jgi:hypothetical protein
LDDVPEDITLFFSDRIGETLQGVISALVSTVSIALAIG